MRTIQSRIDELIDRVNTGDVLDSSGLGNEVNFRVFDYDPDDEYVIRDNINYIVGKHDNIQVFNIYDIIIEILKSKGFLEKTFEYEKTKGAQYVNSIIQKTLAISSNNDLIVKYIKEHFNNKEDTIVFITGIGRSYGIVRAHTILNNLQSVITVNPVILFYPGTYDGQSFRLFNKMENDNYYRAFQLVSRK